MEKSIKSLVGIRNKFWFLFDSEGWHVVVYEKGEVREE